MKKGDGIKRANIDDFEIPAPVITVGRVSARGVYSADRFRSEAKEARESLLHVNTRGGFLSSVRGEAKVNSEKLTNRFR